LFTLFGAAHGIRVVPWPPQKTSGYAVLHTQTAARHWIGAQIDCRATWNNLKGKIYFNIPQKQKIISSI